LGLSGGYRDLQSALPACQFDDATKLLMPTALQWGHIAELSVTIGEFLLVFKWIQTEKRGKCKEVNFATCRTVFKNLIKKFPT
jgi:hypothetical protein